MSQLSFCAEDLNINRAITEEFIPKSKTFSLNTTNAEVKRISGKGSRDIIADFCNQNHYLHQGTSKSVVFSRAYGLYLGGELAGVTVFNVPGSSAVEKSLFSDYEHQKGTLALTRLCCDPEAPFNSESFLLAQSLRLLKHDNIDRLKEQKPAYKTVITYADHGFLGHTGTIYRAINAWYQGTTVDKTLAGFRNPETGQIISARQGKKTLRNKDCPEGFEPFSGTRKFKYLMFLGNPNAQLETMRNLREDVQLRSKFDEFYAWREGQLLKPSDKRAYDEVYNIAGRKAI